MRSAVALLVVSAGCGRFWFDDVPASDGGLPDDAADPLIDAIASPPPPTLACGETLAVTAAPITGSRLKAVVSGRGLSVLWLGAGGAGFATTWTASARGVEVAQPPVSIGAGPFNELWAVGNRDEIAVIARGAAIQVRVFDDDFARSRAIAVPGTQAEPGRAPVARQRRGRGFVAILTTAASGAPQIVELGEAQGHPLPALLGHHTPSIAATDDGYAVVSELDDAFNGGCWGSFVDEVYAVTGGPAHVDSTEQADCLGATIATGVGASDAAAAWTEFDPANNAVWMRGPGGAPRMISGAGEAAGGPLVTVTSSGVAVAYRTATALRVVDAAGTRTLGPPGVLADLVTWGDEAVVVWADAGGAPRLTRLCP